MIYTSYYNSPVGKLLLASKNNKLIGVWIENQKYYLSNLKEKMQIKDDEEILIKTKNWLDRYFENKNPHISELDIEPIGTDFSKKVWTILCTTPYGKVITYGEIAKKISKAMNKDKMSAQAVGNAVAHNPISIIIPCHRVIGANGNLTGYAGGLDIKMRLLKHEGVDISKLFIP